MKFIGKQFVKNTVGFLYYHSYKKFKEKGNRALIYHAFGSVLPHDTYGISIKKDSFINHIDYLRDNYSFTKISNNHDNKLTISITIDDGYKDTLDAIDYITKYKIPFSLYITTNTIGRKNYLNEDDLRNISSLDYCELGTHGHTHSKLGQLPYEAQKEELQSSMKCLEDIIQKKVYCLSYPHGSYNIDTINNAKKIGYLNASTSNKGFNSDFTNKYEKNRIEVVCNDAIDDLVKKINGFYDYY